MSKKCIALLSYFLKIGLLFINYHLGQWRFSHRAKAHLNKSDFSFIILRKFYRVMSIFQLSLGYNARGRLNGVDKTV